MYVNVENVNFAYDKKPILHDINFGMNKGEITGLIGPNGAGKSTMLKLMIKKMKPDNGKIIIGDNDIFSINLLVSLILFTHNSFLYSCIMLSLTN